KKRMIAAGLGDENVAEALAVGGLSVVEKFQAIHVFEIEVERAFGTVNLDDNVVLATESEAGGFEIGQSAIFKAAQERGGVIDGNLAHFLSAFSAEALAFAGFVHERAFFDERVHEATNFLELAHQITAKIDDVRVDVAMGPAAAHTFLQPPDEREFRIDDPVLRVAGVVMINLAD